jgi:hypothetical protein
LNGISSANISKTVPLSQVANMGTIAAKELLENGGEQIAEAIKNGNK